MNIHVVVSHIAALYVWQISGGEKLSSCTKLCLKFSICCENGKVVLSSVASCPVLLMHLPTASDKRGKGFRRRSEPTTVLLPVLLLAANIDNGLANAKQGVYTFRIHGVVYHCIGQLLPKDNEAPEHAQIYMTVALMLSWNAVCIILKMRLSQR